MKKYLLMLLFLLVLSCSDSDNPLENQYITDKPVALIVVVENLDGLEGSYLEAGYELYKEDAMPIFSDMFDVSIDSIDDLSLNEIIEIYGEKWQIEGICAEAENNYDEIRSLTDNQATEENLKNNLLDLKNNGYAIDMVFCLHGSEYEFCLYDKDIVVQNFADFLNNNQINIRMLYQTCCYGAYTISDWEEAGIYAVNGASGYNQMTLFSPAYFLKNWISGMSYEEAVFRAYEEEIAKIESYSSVLPILNFINIEDDEGSIQNIGGQNPSILFSQFPVIN